MISRLPRVLYLCLLVCLTLLIACADSGGSGDADVDTDVDTDADTDTDTTPDWENLVFQGCNEKFNPWAAPERKLLSAPYLVNPTGTSMTVMWETLENEPSFVVWGPGETFTTVTCTTGVTMPFESGDFTDSHEAFLHKAVLEGLEPGTRYSYTRPNAQVLKQRQSKKNDLCEDSKKLEEFYSLPNYRLTDLKSLKQIDAGDCPPEWEELGTWSFATAPEPDDPFSLYVVGDNQPFPSRGNMVADSMVRFPADFYLHLGDIVQDGKFTQYPLNYLWMFRRVLAQTPSIHVSGNHEGNGKVIPYDSYFDIQANGPLGWHDQPDIRYPRTFTWDYGPIRMFLLDTQEDICKESADCEDSRQHAWLDAQLEKTVKQDTHIRYLFGVWHRPILTWKPNISIDESKDIHELMKKWRVDAVWTGHTHWYERLENDGVVYVVSGGAGSGLDLKGEDTRDDGDPFQMSYNRIEHDSCLHFLVGEGNKDQIEFRTIKADDDVVFDSFTILAKDRSDLR